MAVAANKKDKDLLPDDLLLSFFRKLEFSGYTNPKDGLDDYRSEDETIISCE